MQTPVFLFSTKLVRYRKFLFFYYLTNKKAVYRSFPIMLVKLAFYAPINFRFTPKKVLKLCSILKILLLWFHKMLRFISSKT